jgi:hypothetical protein
MRPPTAAPAITPGERVLFVADAAGMGVGMAAASACGSD